mgnify:CR=1 FL=1
MTPEERAQAIDLVSDAWAGLWAILTLPNAWGAYKALGIDDAQRMPSPWRDIVIVFHELDRRGESVRDPDRIVQIAEALELDHASVKVLVAKALALTPAHFKPEPDA